MKTYSTGQLDHVLKTMTPLFSISGLERKQCLFLTWKKVCVSLVARTVRVVYKYKFLGMELLIIKYITCLDTGFYMSNLSVISVYCWESEKEKRKKKPSWLLCETNAKINLWIYWCSNTLKCKFSRPGITWKWLVTEMT